VLRTQDSAQVRAAIAQVQRRKQALVGKIVVCDYIGNPENLAGEVGMHANTRLPLQSATDDLRMDTPNPFDQLEDFLNMEIPSFYHPRYRCVHFFSTF
jgi:hypothetical protein